MKDNYEKRVEARISVARHVNDVKVRVAFVDLPSRSVSRRPRWHGSRCRDQGSVTEVCRPFVSKAVEKALGLRTLSPMPFLGRYRPMG